MEKAIVIFFRVWKCFVPLCLLVCVSLTQRAASQTKEYIYINGKLVAIETVGPPPAPTNLNPEDNATGISLTPTLTWSASTGATSYDIYLGTSADPPLAGNASSTQFTPSAALNSNTIYYWRVAAINSHGSNSSAIIRFTTTNGSAPAAPTGLTPTNGSINISLTPTLAWSASTGATSYDVYFGTGSNPQFAANRTTTNYSPSPLGAGTLYYWKVVAKNASGSNSSAVISFTTGYPPGTPTNLSPSNGATGVSTSATLSWSTASGASSYNIYFGTNSNPPFYSSTSQSSYAMQSLNTNTTYYWRVEAVNSFGTNSSGTIYFSTISGSPTAPTNLVATATTASSVYMTWSQSSAPSGIAYYSVERSTNNTNFAAVGSPTGTSFADNAVSPGLTYVYRIQAVANGPLYSQYSNKDIATTILFTDDPLAAGGTVVIAAHLNELRSAVAAVRTCAGLSAPTWTDTNLAGVIIKAAHIQELRSQLDPAFSAFGMTAPTFTDPTITAGVTVIKAAHVQELRQAVK